MIRKVSCARSPFLRVFFRHPAGRQPARGFTVVEILVVLAVIAILIGIALPMIKGMQDQARIMKATGDLRTLQTALASYAISHQGLYPSSSDAVCADALLSQSPQIVGAALYDPFGATGTSEYKYKSSPNQKQYLLWSAGLPGQIAPTNITDTGEIIY